MQPRTRDDGANHAGQVASLAALPAMLRQLQECTSVPILFSRAAEVARTAGGYDRAIVLTVSDDILSSRECGALEHDASDVLRRRFLRQPLKVPANSREGRWLRRGVRDVEVDARAPSVFDDPALQLGHVATGLIAPETDVLAVIIGCRDSPIPTLEAATTAAAAAMTAVALSRLVLTARLDEVAGVLRDLSMSTEALIQEVLRSPIQVPTDGASGPAFPSLQRAHASSARRARDVLTDREIEVAELLAAGSSDRDIAARLVVSVNTAKDHVVRIRRKLDAGNRAEAAAKYLRLTNQA